MNSFSAGGAILALTVGATWTGWRLVGKLPPQILDIDTRDVLKMLIGVLGTLSALVLSLLINSARASYDQQHQEVMELSAKLLSLDRALARYGPDASPIRRDLKTLVAAAVEELWPADPRKSARVDAPLKEEVWVQRLQSLSPVGESQRLARDQAVGLATDIMNLRWMLYEQSTGSVPTVMLAVLSTWFALIFFCIGLLSPRTSHVLLPVLILLSCGSVSAAMVLGLELDRAFEGLLRVSGEPVLKALSHLGQ